MGSLGKVMSGGKREDCEGNGKVEGGKTKIGIRVLLKGRGR